MGLLIAKDDLLSSVGDDFAKFCKWPLSSKIKVWLLKTRLAICLDLQFSIRGLTQEAIQVYSVSAEARKQTNAESALINKVERASGLKSDDGARLVESSPMRRKVFTS